MHFRFYMKSIDSLAGDEGASEQEQQYSGSLLGIWLLRAVNRQLAEASIRSVPQYAWDRCADQLRPRSWLQEEKGSRCSS